MGFITPLTVLLNNNEVEIIFNNSTEIVCAALAGTGANHSLEIISGSVNCRESLLATWSYPLTLLFVVHNSDND